MITFGIINAKARTTFLRRAKELRDVYPLAGLKDGSVDHGLLLPRLAYVVYEYGFFQPYSSTHFFTIGSRLVAGGAVLYAIGERGETVDLEWSAVPPVRFLTGEEALREVEAGLIVRPETRVNGHLIWRWPDLPGRGQYDETKFDPTKGR